MRPGIPHVFVDCDDCVYQNQWKTAVQITNAIANYTATIGVDKEKAYQLYKTYGTCLKGLIVENIIDQDKTEEFLRRGHDIDYADITPDPALCGILRRLCRVAPTYIFTASTKEHALRCLERVGAHDADWRDIIDTRSCSFETKYSELSFAAAMRIADASDPSQCLFFDDSVKNIKAARAFGWRTVLVGMIDRDTGDEIICEEAEVHIASLHELPDAVAKLFPDLSFSISQSVDCGTSERSAKTLPL